MKKVMINVSVLLCSLLTIYSCGKKDKPVVDEQKAISDLTSVMQAKPAVSVKTIGILLYDGYTSLDAMGPYQVLSELPGVKVFFVAKQKGSIADAKGTKILVDTSIAEVQQLDVLVVPGGFRETYNMTRDMPVIDWIKKIDSGSVYTTSVCTGAWILGAAGLLDNKNATTHWYGKDILRNEFGAKIEDKRFVRDGKYWTSAGVTAGMDMSYAMIGTIMGEPYAKISMLNLEYDPKPPYEGGSVNNTPANLVEGMRIMYNQGMETALHPEKLYKDLRFANERDPICHMPVGAGVADTAHFNGKVYGFCSSGCKDAFKVNPSGYIATGK
jgi:putative intracellular protease/amidase/YHS domain-containing protein